MNLKFVNAISSFGNLYPGLTEEEAQEVMMLMLEILDPLSDLEKLKHDAFSIIRRGEERIDQSLDQ